MACRHTVAAACLLLATGKRADEPKLLLRGVLRLGNEWRAAIASGETGAAGWFQPGDPVGSFIVATIDAESAALDGPTGALHILRLPEARILDRRVPPADPMAWAIWVNSRDNPMRDQPADPPINPAQWRTASDEQRQALSNWYRDHGWELSAAITADGTISFEFAPINGVERQVIAAEKERAFLASLSPGQRVLHTAAMRERAPEASAAPDATSARGRFLASLNPQQRAAFDRIRDPEIPVRSTAALSLRP